MKCVFVCKEHCVVSVAVLRSVISLCTLLLVTLVALQGFAGGGLLISHMQF